MRLKFAPRFAGPPIVITQFGLVPYPEQSPVQPANDEPPSATAVSVTTAPLAYGAEHVLPQLTPGTSLVTVPDPLPGLLTVSMNPSRTVSADWTKLLFGSGSSA